MRSWTLGTPRCVACPNQRVRAAGALQCTMTDCHLCLLVQIVDPSILKQYIFQKGFITEAAKAKREAEAQAATLQVRTAGPSTALEVGCAGWLFGCPLCEGNLAWPATMQRRLCMCR